METIHRTTRDHQLKCLPRTTKIHILKYSYIYAIGSLWNCTCGYQGSWYIYIYTFWRLSYVHCSHEVLWWYDSIIFPPIIHEQTNSPNCVCVFRTLLVYFLSPISHIYVLRLWFWWLWAVVRFSYVHHRMSSIIARAVVHIYELYVRWRRHRLRGRILNEYVAHFADLRITHKWWWRTHNTIWLTMLYTEEKDLQWELRTYMFGVHLAFMAPHWIRLRFSLHFPNILSDDV